MTDERDPSGRGFPRNGEYDAGEGAMREGQPRDPNGRDPHRPGFSDQEPGVHRDRGPRRSRYGRRRMPNDGGGGEYGGGGYQDHRPRGGEPAGDDVENYLPSFISGPSNGGGEPHPQPAQHARHDAAPQHAQQPSQHQPQHERHPGHQGPPGGHQQHGGGHPAPPHQPVHLEHPVGYQGHPAHQPPQPEEPSPEVQAAAAAFAEWEDSNPKLRGLLVCSATVKRGEPIVRGTRIPARILAAIAKMGSSVEEMLQDYPALTREGLDAALAFASANPRKPA